jgi:hypothetical protein
MEYFAGLDISMDDTHTCVLDREGAVVYERRTTSTAQAIADELTKAPSCGRIVFETGRMAPILFHGLSQLGFSKAARGSGCVLVAYRRPVYARLRRIAGLVALPQSVRGATSTIARLRAFKRRSIVCTRLAGKSSAAFK